MATGSSSQSRIVPGRSPGEAAAAAHAPHFSTPVGSPPPAAPLCWGLSIGVAGMLSQMKGLARALGYEFLPIRTRLRRGWHWLPMSLVPRTFAVVRDAELLDVPEPPRLVIACGRHSVIPTICLKRAWGERIFTVFIQDPLVDSTNFDMVVAPEHDAVRGPNVLQTRGALHHVNADVLEAARETPLARKLDRSPQRTVTVLLGGPNRYYGFTPGDVGRLIDKLQMLVDRDEVSLVVVPSRRTPAAICRRFHEAFGAQHYVWNGGDENPYLAALAIADYIVVTGDSVSMTTEASATGRPLFVEQLSERLPARRFRRFQDSFRRAGISRPFQGRLEYWTYLPPDDTATVARTIMERMGR